MGTNASLSLLFGKILGVIFPILFFLHVFLFMVTYSDFFPIIVVPLHLPDLPLYMFKDMPSLSYFLTLFRVVVLLSVNVLEREF